MSLTQTPKIAPKGPKRAKKAPQKKPDKKQKDRAVYPKPKLIVYISRSQNFFEPDSNPKIAPKAKKAPFFQRLQ